MKINYSQKIRLILGFGVLFQSVIYVDSAAISEENHNQSHEHHHIHHDNDHDSIEVIEIALKNHGEDCFDENSKCNGDAGLICFQDVGKCDCDKHIGLVYVPESGKCQEVPVPELPSLPESFDNLLDPLGEEDTTSTTTTSTTMKMQEVEVDVMPILSESADDNKLEDTVVDNKLEDSVVEVNLCEGINCNEDLGQHSKCEERTGQCICEDMEGKNRSLVVINGQCVIERKINDECSSHEECSATIKGNAWCHMDIVTRKRFCQCEVFNYFDETIQECLPLASDGLFSPCKTNRQCTGFEVAVTGHGLGPHSRCADSGLCECKLGPDGQKGFLTENYCFPGLKLGDICNFDKECQVALPGQDVYCNTGKLCACRNGDGESCPFPKKEFNLGGRTAEGDNVETAEEPPSDDGLIDKLKSAMGLTVPNFVFLMIIAAVVLLVVVIISVFIIRKRHKYTVVRSHDTPDKNSS